VEANVYRFLLPLEFGGENVDPLTYYDLVEEVSSYDGSAGWNYSIGSSTPGSARYGLRSWPASRLLFRREPACDVTSPMLPNVRLRPCNSVIGRPAARQFMSRRRSNGP